MEKEPFMRFTEEMIVSQVGDTWFAVSLGKSEGNTSKMVRLNSTAKEIFEGLQEGKTAEEIANSLVDRYEVDREKAIQSTWNVIHTLKEKGVLTD